MKKIVLCFGLALAGMTYSTAWGQTTTATAQQAEITSLRPADGRPYSFSTEAEKVRVSTAKIAELKELIAANPDDVARVTTCRELIWRFENAVIAPVSGSN